MRLLTENLNRVVAEFNKKSLRPSDFEKAMYEACAMLIVNPDVVEAIQFLLTYLAKNGCFSIQSCVGTC